MWYSGKSLGVLFFSYTLMLWSCSKNEEITPIETPEANPIIQIGQPIMDASIRGIITIGASVELSGTKSTLGKVTLLVDNIVLKEFEQTSISTSWNSESVSDGTHTIKV